MYFLMIQSPLVTSEIWRVLSADLLAEGYQTIVVELDNTREIGDSLYQTHADQIESALAAIANEPVIAIAHSGAGNLLACLDPCWFEGHVFLDAIFPIERASRFDLFDNTSVVQNWRDLAAKHAGKLPISMLARFGEQIEDQVRRRAFVSDLVDVPIELYEEKIPVHPNWPSSKRGLYVQWTHAYAADAARAKAAGFEVRLKQASHFKMLNQPDEVVRELVDFALETEAR